MAGICSAHQGYEPNCRLCNLTPRDLFPDWDEKLAEAKAAGEHTCEGCGFVYYKTAEFCPLCEKYREPEGKDDA